MMRKISYLVLLLILPFVGFSQTNRIKGKTLKISNNSKLIGSVTVGSSSFDGSAILTVTSSTQGALMPRMNTTARDNISAPTDGLLIFNTSTNQYEYFETTWQAVGNGAADGNGIFDASGTLTASPTTVTMDTKNMVFASTGESDLLKIAASNNTIGMGLSNPSARLHIKGINATSAAFGLKVDDNALTPHFRVRNDGNIGMGIAEPVVDLHILHTSNTSSIWNIASSADGKQAAYVGGESVVEGDYSQFVRFSNASTAVGDKAGALSGLLFITNNINNILISGKRFATGSDFFPTIYVNDSGGGGRVGMNTNSPSEMLQVVGNVIIDSSLSTTARTTTLGFGITTFPVFSNVMTITGDGAGNTIATITGANSGMVLSLIFVDVNVTITDTDDGGSDTIDLGSAFTSADDTVLVLVYDGTLWRESSRSVN